MKNQNTRLYWHRYKLYLVWSIVLASVLMNTAFAANQTSQHQVAVSNQSVQMQQVFDLLAQQSLVRADFQQKKQLPSINKTFQSNGKIVFSKTSGVLWQIQKPVQADLVMTPKKLVQKTERTQSEITLDKSPYGAVANIFLQLMAGDQKTLSQNFNVQSIVIDRNKIPMSWTIRLEPKSNLLKKMFNRVDASGNQFVQNIVIYESGNSITTINFSQHKTAPAQFSDQEHALFQLAK